jgi:putative tricarboxylic transport membrane protein
MNRYEQIYNVVWMLLGIGICAQSLQLNLWDPSSGPGSGFIPFLCGLFIAAAGFLLLILEFFKGPQTKSTEKLFGDPIATRRILYILGGLCAMALLLPILGFLLTSILITTFMLRVIEPQRWAAVILTSLASCFVVYWLFSHLLQVSLPKGFLGI